MSKHPMLMLETLHFCCDYCSSDQKEEDRLSFGLFYKMAFGYLLSAVVYEPDPNRQFDHRHRQPRTATSWLAPSNNILCTGYFPYRFRLT